MHFWRVFFAVALNSFKIKGSLKWSRCFGLRNYMSRTSGRWAGHEHCYKMFDNNEDGTLGRLLVVAFYKFKA